MRKIPTEPRECVECGDAYEWNSRNIYCLCVPCRKSHYKKSQKLSDEDYKKPYPLNQNEKRNRYRRIAKELDKAETPEQRREIYRREMEYMIESGIWLWCVDIRFSTKVIDRGSGKRGRKSLDSKTIPDTRGYYE